MKKITLLVSGLVVCGVAFGQSQRVTLAEEFTQASCGPCAAQNPAFNALVAPNFTAGKIITVKYQTSWPGTDPMNVQTASEVAARVTYYGVSGVPNIEYDGNVLSNAAPSALTQSGINTEYAVASPFTINVTHSFNAAYDSVFINCVITASQNFTAGSASSLIAHVAMVEEQINFTTAPGTNGERDFYSVMRKMYPNASGTTLPQTWTNGQSQTLTFAAALPSYIYSKAQIGIVAFIQDNSNKNVKQAGYSIPQALPLDAGTTVVAVPSVQCSTTITPMVTIKNYGLTTLTSCTINYKIDNGTVMTLPWTGSLATGATEVVTLPTQTTTAGSHTFTSFTSAPNAATDFDNANNQIVSSFAIMATAVASPVAEGFVSTTFPPTNWVRVAGGQYPWARATTGVAPTTGNSAKANFFSDAAGAIEDLYVKPIDLTTTMAHSGLTFDVAYAQYSATFVDQLDVEVSTNCGTTWTNVYSKTAGTLATNGGALVTTAYTPTTAQWRKENVDLTAYNNQTNVLVRFRATSGYGNNLYVDNINLFSSASQVGINEISSTVNFLEVYPNPMTDNATVNFNLANPTNVTLAMYNVLGEAVYTSTLGQMSTGTHNVSLDAQKLEAGMYYITLTVNDGTITKKVSITK